MTLPYTINPSPLSSPERVVVTSDPEAEKLLLSLGARHAPAVGWYLKPSRVKLFEALWNEKAVYARTGFYRFPDGAVRHLWGAREYLKRRRATA